MDEGSQKAEIKIELALRWQGGDAGLSCRRWSPDRSPEEALVTRSRWKICLFPHSRRKSLPYWARRSLYPLSRDARKCGFNGQGLGSACPPRALFSIVRTSGRCAQLFRKREVRLPPQFPRGLGASPRPFLPPYSSVSQSYKRGALSEVQGGLEMRRKGAPPSTTGRKGGGGPPRGAALTGLLVSDGEEMEDLQPARAQYTFAASPHPPARSHLQRSGGEGDENRQQSPRGVTLNIRLTPVWGGALPASPAPRPAHHLVFGTAGRSYYVCGRALPRDLYSPRSHGSKNLC